MNADEKSAAVDPKRVGEELKTEGQGIPVAEEHASTDLRARDQLLLALLAVIPFAAATAWYALT